ncbi:MAG TPA: hypothetical protein VD926_02345, partial [Acidimicrobiales bacterium]|nr:hypothetical protein [Acidimicrobiales bacterium]
FGEGADRLREQIEELEAHGHDWGAANLRAVRVIFLVIAGRSEEARHEVAAAMGAARKVGSPTLLVVATYAEGMAHLHDDPDRALGAFEESLALVADGASDIVYAETLEQVARLRLRRGDLAEAVDALAEGLRFAADIGNRWIYTACLWHGLEVFEAVGAHDLVAMAAGLSGPGGSLVPVEMQTDDPSAARARDEVCRRARLELGADRYDELEVAAERLSFEAAVPRVSEALDGLRRRLTSPERA